MHIKHQYYTMCLLFNDWLICHATIVKESRSIVNTQDSSRSLLLPHLVQVLFQDNRQNK